MDICVKHQHPILFLFMSLAALIPHSYEAIGPCLTVCNHMTFCIGVTHHKITCFKVCFTMGFHAASYEDHSAPLKSRKTQLSCRAPVHTESNDLSIKHMSYINRYLTVANNDFWVFHMLKLCASYESIFQAK